MNNTFKTAILLGALTGLMLVIGFLIGGQTGLIVALVFSILMNFAMWFWSAKIALLMYKAKPADPKIHRELFAIVQDLSLRAKIPMPKVYIIESATPNAFATGRSPEHAAVAATTGLLNLMERKEIEGVIAHELAHVKHRDILIASIAATVAGVISSVAAMARWATIFGSSDDDGGNIISLILLGILAPFIAVIIQLAISRSREYAADATGARIAGSPEGLARALEKLEKANHAHPLESGSTSGASLFIVNPFSGRTFANLFSTHPPVADRVRKLRAMQIY